MSNQDEERRSRRRLLTVAGVCFLVGSLAFVTSLTSRLSFLRATLRWKQVRALVEKDTKRNDDLQARLAARAGLAQALARLSVHARSGTEFPPEFSGSLGMSHAGGADTYTVRVLSHSERIYSLELSGEIASGRVSQSGRPVIAAAYSFRARVRIRGTSAELLDVSKVPR
jgi:hypothetical protein